MISVFTGFGMLELPIEQKATHIGGGPWSLPRAFSSGCVTIKPGRPVIPTIGRQGWYYPEGRDEFHSYQIIGGSTKVSSSTDRPFTEEMSCCRSSGRTGNLALLFPGSKSLVSQARDITTSFCEDAKVFRFRLLTTQAPPEASMDRVRGGITRLSAWACFPRCNIATQAVILVIVAECWQSDRVICNGCPEPECAR